MDKLEAACGGAFLDELVMVRCFRAREIAQRDGISLHLRLPPLEAPGQFQLHRPVLVPTAAAMRIPAATASDIDDICCKKRWSSTPGTERRKLRWYTSASMVDSRTSTPGTTCRPPPMGMPRRPPHPGGLCPFTFSRRDAGAYNSLDAGPAVVPAGCPLSWGDTGTFAPGTGAE